MDCTAPYTLRQGGISLAVSGNRDKQKASFRAIAYTNDKREKIKYSMCYCSIIIAVCGGVHGGKEFLP